jgi:hypothetical protein
MGQRLDDKLDCKQCGTISLEIPVNASEDTPIHCSTCGVLLGTWGVLQDNFYRQATSEAFDIENGNIFKHDGKPTRV